MTLINFRYLLLAALLSLLISPLAARAVVWIGLVDRPNAEPHKKHLTLVPLAGGIVISVVLMIIGSLSGLLENKDVRGILVAGLVILLFGAVDDFHPLSPAWKLVGQIAGAVLLVLLGVQVQIFRYDILNYGITLFWLVGVTNAFNFVDSMDGLAAGLAGVAAGLFMLVAYDSGQLHLSSLSAILVGICASVYYFSASPARYFLGDSGAQYLGFLLAGLAIAYNPLGFIPAQSWFIPIMLLGVPLYDGILVISSRFRRRKPIYHSGLDHTYHRLVSMGMHPNRAVLTMHFGAILLGCLAFIMLAMPPLWANLIFVILIAAGIVGLVYLEKWI